MPDLVFSGSGRTTLLRSVPDVVTDRSAPLPIGGEVAYMSAPDRQSGVVHLR
jgi:hypothetical protein